MIPGELEVNQLAQTRTIFPNVRNSRPEMLCEKDVLRNFAKFTGKHLCQSLFFNKVTLLQEALAQVLS